MAERTIENNSKRWAREYETVYILRPNVSPEEAERVADRVKSVMDKAGAKIVEVETWGLRRLAYSIKKHRRGVFIYVKFVSFADVPAELERNLRLLEQVIRFQTIIVNEKVDLEATEVDGERAAFDEIEQAEEEEELSTAALLGMEDPRDITDAAAADESEAGDKSDSEEE